MTFKQFIWHGQDSQKQRRKDVPVEHKDTFWQLPAESKDYTLLKKRSGREKEEKNTRPDPSPLIKVMSTSLISAVALHLKTHLKVERQAVIIEKDGLRYLVRIKLKR